MIFFRLIPKGFSKKILSISVLQSIVSHRLLHELKQKLNMYFVNIHLALIFSIMSVALEGVFAQPNDDRPSSSSETIIERVVFDQGESITMLFKT